MKAISLFSGAGGDTLGLKQAGIKIKAYIELDKTFCESHDSNFEKCKLIGNDITTIKDDKLNKYKDKIDIIFAGFPCFLADTKVITNRGCINIQDVSLEDELLTHTGNFQKIVNLQRKIYDKSIYHIKVKYHPYPIKCTPEHPFYV